jgi:putative phage-type endonuclease
MDQQMEQQTNDWLRFRQKRIGSSDASVIMKQSPWSTPHKLWLEKTGKVPLEQKSNFAIERGNRWEPVARARYELRTGLELPATVLVHPRYKFLMASLDGYSEQDKVICEIKCFTSVKNFECVKGGKIPATYWPQVQHQLLVSGAKEVHFFCCLIGKQGMNEAILDDALVVVQPDEQYQKDMLEQELAFYRFMLDDIAPPLSADDYLEADDQSTVLLFSKIKPIKLEIQRKLAHIDKVEAELKELEAELNELREEVIEHVETLNHNKITSVGVNMIKDKNGHWQIRLAGKEEA